MSANLDRVLDEVRSLSPDDLKQLRAKLDEMLAPQTQMTEAEFAQHLLSKGIISRIPQPPTEEEIAAYQERKPATLLGGKPVSETLIEERR